MTTVNDGIEIPTNTELLRRIVMTERVSCGYNGGPSTRCSCEEGDCPCHSLGFREVHGRVLTLSPDSMRRTCPCIAKPAAEYLTQTCDGCRRTGVTFHGDNCLNCGGQGWIPNPDPWKMRTALRHAGFILVERSTLYGEQPHGAVCGSPSSMSREDWIWDADPERARLLAVMIGIGA